MLARWNSEGNFESIFKKNTVSSEAKSIFKDISDLDLNSKTIAWDKWADSMVKTDKNLKAFLITEEEAYKTKDLATYTKYLNDHNKTLDLATLKTKAWAFAKNAALNIGFTLIMMGVSKVIDNMVNSQENAIKKADEFIKKYEEQRDALTSNKQTIDSISADYEKLAKGVDSLGRNVSLNSDEYARYNEIVNQIADMFPQMVQGYTDEGNAIISHKGNVEELTKAYQEQKKAAQDAIIIGSADVFKGFKAKVDNSASMPWEETGLLQQKDIIEKIISGYSNGTRNHDIGDSLNATFEDLKETFEAAGIDVAWYTASNLDLLNKYLTEDNIPKLQAYFNTLKTQIDTEASKIKPIMQAYLEQSFEFQGLDEKAQDIVKQIVGQFDSEFYAQFDNETEMATWVTENIVNKFKGKDGNKIAIEFGAMFDLQTKFNEGDITVAEYQEKLSAFLTLIGSLPDETQKAIKLLFGIKTGEDGAETSDFDTMLNNVKEKFKGKFEEEIGGLSLPELEILTNLDISPDGIKDWSEVETLIANAGKEANRMTVSLSELKTASDNISSLSSAFKEISDDGYLSVETISKIQEATKLSGEEWESYKTKLLNAKAGSVEFNQIMSEMTLKVLEASFATTGLENATEDEIEAILRENGVVNASALAHEYSAIAKGKAKAKTSELLDEVDDAKSKLIEEAESCGISTAAYAQLVAQETIFNNNDLDISNKISKLATLQQALGQTTSAAIGLNSALAGQSIDGRLEMAMAIQQYGIKRTAKGYEYNGIAYNSGKDAVNAAMMADFSKNLKIDIPSVDYSGALSGGKSGSDNKPDYEDPTDAIINRINLRSKELEQQEESIQNAIEIAELENDYKKQISLTNDLIAKRKDRLTELETANAGLHNEAEYQRSIHTFYNKDGTESDENLWFDSQGNATMYYNALINKTGITTEEREAIEALFEKLSKYKKAYAENAEEIVGLNKEILQDEEKIWDLKREEFDERLEESEYYIQHSKDFGWENGDNEIAARKRVLDWIQSDYYKSLIKDDEEYYKILEEHRLNYIEAQKEQFNKATDFASSYKDSQKTLLQSYFDITNSIEEAHHEINKELEASKTMYEWLDEDTRQLLFNQEDYNALSRELNEIQNEALHLKADYEEALNNATLDTIEEITSNYEMQYEMLMKSYEIAKADLEVAKKKAKLNNVLNERNVRMFINGQWQWVANTQDVMDAKAELADAEYAQRMAKAGAIQQESINDLTRQQNELNTTIKQFESGVIDLDTAVGNVKDIFGELPSYIKEVFNEILSSISSARGSSGKSGSSSGKSGSSSRNNATASIPGVGPDVPVDIVNGRTTTAGLPVGTIVHTAGGDFKITGGTAGNYTSEPVIKEHASGTRYTPGGLTALGEIEPEMFITNNGHLVPINQPTIGNIGAGGIVFNQDQMAGVRELWDLSNIVTPSTSFVNNARTPTESFIFSGDINVYNPTDAQDVADNVVAHIVQGLKLQRKSR